MDQPNPAVNRGAGLHLFCGGIRTTVIDYKEFVGDSLLLEPFPKLVQRGPDIPRLITGGNHDRELHAGFTVTVQTCRDQ